MNLRIFYLLSETMVIVVYLMLKKGGIIVNSEVREIMRIYSEKLDITMLKSIQKQIIKIIPKLKIKAV